MTFPSSVWNDITSTTIANYSATMADNVSANNGLLTIMKKKQGDLITGGDPIIEIFNFAENGNGGSYSGNDILPTAASDTASAAQYILAKYAVPIVYNGSEMLANTGKQQMFDLIKAKVMTGNSTIKNLINRHMFLDGTGNNGKNLTGLAAALPLAPTNVYGGIDRSVSTNAFWKNQKWQASVDSTGIATAATIQAQWDNFVLLMTRGTDKPNVIIADKNVYAIFQASLQPQQRFMNADSASAGFISQDFQGIPVLFESLASGIGSNTAYFINTDYLHYRPHKDRNFTSLDEKSSVNQDSTVKTLVWAGNLTCSGPQFSGIFSNT